MNRNGELAIYEVYYTEDGKVAGYSAEPVLPAAETLDALRANCELYTRALDKPVLTFDD